MSTNLLTKTLDEVMANAANRMMNNGAASTDSSAPPLHQSSGDESTAARLANTVTSSSESVDLPDVGSIALIDAAVNDLPQKADDATIYAMQCDDVAEAVVRAGGPLSDGLQWQRQRSAQAVNSESLVPGDPVKLTKEAKRFIEELANRNVVWSVHHKRVVDVGEAENMFFMKGMKKWNPDPHKVDGMVYNKIVVLVVP